MKAIIFDKGDPSVGLNPTQWAIDCPFEKDVHYLAKEWFRKGITKLYDEFANGKISVLFDEELEMLQDSEKDPENIKK